MATAMIAVLAGSLYATLHTVFMARRRIDATIEPIRRTELALELVRTDLESVMPPTGILAQGFLGEDGTDASGQPTDSLLMCCTAGGAVDTEGTGDIRQVELTCEADPDDGTTVLVRRVYRYLLATRVEEPIEEVLCHGVRSFDLKYHDGIDWQESWDSTTRGNALPLAVQVSLVLTSDGTDRSDETAAVAGATVGPGATRVFRMPMASLAEEALAGEAAP